jgi:hypothetical protein
MNPNEKQENYQTEASPVATKSWIQMCSLIFTFVDWQLIDATTFSCSNDSNSNQINSSAIIEKLEIHKVKIDQNICCILHIQIPMQISEKKNWKINNYLSSQDLNCLVRDLSEESEIGWRVHNLNRKQKNDVVILLWLRTHATHWEKFMEK